MKRNLLSNLTKNFQQKITNSLFGFVAFTMLLILSTTSVRAQSVINDYPSATALVESIGPAYVPLVGGTSVIGAGFPAFGFTTSTPASLVSINAVVPIGFNFVYNNETFSQLTISDNGFITFGATAPGAITNPINIGTGYRGAISAYGSSLVGNYLSISNTAVLPANYNNDNADILYQVSGLPGSRVFTIEWKNVKRRLAFPTTTLDNPMNFQIRLYEANMKIEVQYATLTFPAPNVAQGAIGLRGSSSADFQTRINGVAGVTATFYNTLSGTVGQTMPTRNNVVGTYDGPPANLMFSWTPGCFNPTNLITNLQVDNTTVDFSWSPPAFQTASFANYIWEVRLTAFPFTTIAGPTTTAGLTGSVTGLLTGTSYTFSVRSNCKPFAQSITATVTPSCATPVFPYSENFEGVVAPAIPNCTSVVNTTGALMRTRDAASGVLYPPLTPIGSYGGFANKNLITGSAANTDTWFFTRAISLIAGNSYKVSYKYGGSRELAQFSQRMRVCIGLAATSAGMTTTLADHVNIKTTPNTFTFHFVAAATGAYFLGINGVAPFNNGYLQVDDISVNTPTCSPPTALVSGAITFNSAVVSWTAAAPVPSAGYEYFISTVATVPISTTIISGATLGTVNTFTGLLPSTTYFVWVRSSCGGEFSAWSPLVSFVTLAPPPAPCIPAPSSVDGTGITNVTIGSINNTTGSEVGNYGNYSSLVTNIAQGTTVNVILRYSTGIFGYFTRIWIDFNDNGSFADAGETVYNSVVELPPGVNNISFSVPGAAPLGQHRMRIGGADGDALAGFSTVTTPREGPCYNGTFGTFEDYSVLVTSPPPPLILSSSSTSFCNGGTSPLVTLNFNAYGGAPAVRYDNFVWNPIAGVAGTPAGGYTFTPSNAGINVYTLTATQATFPFVSNTVTYTITVNDVPTPIVFTPTTLNVCEGIPAALTSGGGIVTGALILEENFNGSDVFSRPTPWIPVNNSTGGTNIPAAAWTLRPSPFVYGGRTFVSNDASQFCMSNSDAQGNGGGSTTSTQLISPLMSFVGYTNVSLSYWQYYREFPTGIAETLVWVDTDSNGAVNGAEVATAVQSFSTVVSGAQSNFVNITTDLSAFAGQTNVRINFKYRDATWAWYWAIDNVKVTGSGPASLTWAPTAGLFTDVLGTIAYTGTPATVVYAKLSNNAIYTATAASLAPPFCNTSSVLNVTVTKSGSAVGDQVLSCGDTTLTSNITLTGYVPLLPGTITGWQMADNIAFTGATTVPSSAGKNILTPADVSGLTQTTYFRAMIVGCPTLFSNTITVSYPTSTWTGVWTPGPPGPSDNVTVASGTLTLNADLNICSLNVSNNANVIVNPGATLTVNGAVIIAGGVPGGNLEFRSDNTFATGTASLMQNPATTVSANGGAGFARYERWITTRKFDYTYWSAPMNPSPLIDVSPSTLSDKFIRWDANAYQYVFLNAAATSMTPGVGYGVRGPQGYSETVFTNHRAQFRGRPNNGDISVQVFRNLPGNDLNWIGNPYPSAIDADLLMDGNVGPLGAAAVGTTFYFWTSNTQYLGGPYNNADFATYNRTGGTLGGVPTDGVPGQMAQTPNGIISSCQGFLVKAVTVAPVTGSPVVFRNTMRVAGNNLQFYRQTNNNEKSRIWLDYTNVNSADQYKQILVGYLPNATNGYEDGFDGELIDLGNQITFYSLTQADAKKLVIQGRSLPFDNTDQVPLGYRASAASTYKIALSNQDGLFDDDLVGIYLEDTLLGVIHDLRQSPYEFVTESGTFDTRFVLRYNNGLLAVNPTDLNENNVVVFKQNEQIHVETSLVKMKSVKIFDMQGRLVIEKNDINSHSAALQKVGLANQVLMVQITSIDGVTVSKKIIF